MQSTTEWFRLFTFSETCRLAKFLIHRPKKWSVGYSELCEREGAAPVFQPMIRCLHLCNLLRKASAAAYRHWGIILDNTYCFVQWPALSPTAACYSQSMWDDLHGTVSVGVGTISNLLDKHSPWYSAEQGKQLSDTRTLPLAYTTCFQNAAQTLQSMWPQFNNKPFKKAKNRHSIFVTQEVVPTSNSNNVVSLCRLFSMLLSEQLNTNPADENIHTWIKVEGLFH